MTFIFFFILLLKFVIFGRDVTPTSQPSRYHQNLVDHAHPKQAKTQFCLCNIAWRCLWVARRNTLPDRLAGDTYR